MRAFLFYIDDWLSSKAISMMDASEERGYLRLIMAAASAETCSVPDNDTQLAILSLLGPQWFKPTKDKDRRIGKHTSGQKLRECFTFRPEGAVDGQLYNQRLHKEWIYQRGVNDRRKANGSMGGRPKKPNGYPNGNHTVIPGEPYGVKSEKLTETNDVYVSVSDSGFDSKKKPEVILSRDFSQFWNRWVELTQRKQKESDALRAWIGSVEPDTALLALACLERYGKSGEVQRGVVCNADKWIYEQARDDWNGDWPGPRTDPPAGGRASRVKNAMAEALRDAELVEQGEAANGKTDGSSCGEITWKVIAYSAISRRKRSDQRAGSHADSGGAGHRSSDESDRRAA